MALQLSQVFEEMCLTHKTKSEGQTKNPHKIVNLEGNFLICPLNCSALFGYVNCGIWEHCYAQNSVAYAIKLFYTIRLSTCVL